MNSYYRYWGKAEKDGPRFHLLPYHCLDVAAVGWLLMDPAKPLCQRLARHMAMAPEELQRWFSFFLCLHDIGKFAVVFQGLMPNLSPKLVKLNERKKYTERHDSLGYCLWNDEYGLCDRLEAENSWLAQSANPKQLRRTLDVWMQIVTGHHGIPPKNGGVYLTNHFDKQDEEAAWLYLLTISRMFISEDIVSIQTDKEFFKRLKNISWILAGIVVLADWLGSSRPTDMFRQQAITLEDYWHNDALPYAVKAVEHAGLEPSPVAPYLNTHHLFDFITTLTPLQQWAENVELPSTNQLFILEDVTGAGKTEAALALAHRLMANGLADGLYVALPTMATSNAMYERLGKAYRRLFPETASPSLVLAHGARHLSEAFRKSLSLLKGTDIQQHYNRDEETIEAVCSAWLADSRKKALLAEVGVGTLDQALLAVLPARHQSLRCLGLTRKILLIDEVHAYDPYMNKLLQALIEYHAAQGGSAILLSATLPFDMRDQYLQAFCKGAGREVPRLKETKQYPLSTHFPAKQLESALATRREVERTVTVVLLDDADAVLERIRQAIEQVKCVCWVRNTVGDATTTYRLLARQEWLDKDRISLFHSRFAMIDRQRIESETLGFFGKDSTAEMRRGRVLIATQVVEQSLDLDFDLMISDLAPIDLLIQRMGREHRHIRDAAGNRLNKEGAVDQREVPIFYIFGPPTTETPAENWLKAVLPGTQKVYQNVGQLWLTQKLLSTSGQLSMPGDARGLIEGVYGEEAQDGIPASLQELSHKAIADAYAESGVARMNTLKLSKGYSRASAEDSGGWEEEAKIPTRLGDDTVRVALLRAEGEVWLPYADDKDFPWEQSMVNVPLHSWRRASEAISAQVQGALDKLKEEVNVLKWVELFPLTAELSIWYDKLMGWGIQKEGADESD